MSKADSERSTSSGGAGRTSDDISALSALDWIAVLIVAGGVVFCVSFPGTIGAPFRSMFQELGSTPTGLTGLVLSSWFVPVVVLVPVALLTFGMLPRQPLGRRRALIVAAFVAVALCAVMCLVSMYLPVFELAPMIDG